jgi:hypothetical protein
MLSADELASQGVSLLPAATPPSVNNGLVLNGTTQYATVPLAWYAQAFQGGTPGEVSIYFEFFPDFNYTEAVDRALCDGVAPNRYVIYKGSVAPYNLYFYAGATTLLAQVSSATYGGLWATGQRNRVVACMLTGASVFYLNGTQIGTSGVAWSRVLPAQFSIGSSVLAGGANYFDGTITDFRIYNRKLTSAEALSLTALT